MKRILSHRSFFLGLCALVSIILILFFSAAAFSAAADAADTWLHVILPTLLPFSVLSAIFVKSGAAERLSRYAAPISRLFGFSDPFAYIFFMSLLSGYPIGAKLTASLYKQGQLSKSEASLIVNAASTSGPAFLVSAISLNMLGSAEYIPAVLVPHILSAVIVAKLNGSIPHPRKISANTFSPPPPLSSIFFDAVSDSVSSMLAVLGAMVLFGALSSVFSFLLTGVCPIWLSSLFTGILEFSSGCISASSLDPALALPIIAFISGFGSLSVCLQTASVCSSCSIPLKCFLRSKLLQGALAALIASFFARSLSALLVSTCGTLLFGFLFFSPYLFGSFSAHKKAIRCR